MKTFEIMNFKKPIGRSYKRLKLECMKHNERPSVKKSERDFTMDYSLRLGKRRALIWLYERDNKYLHKREHSLVRRMKLS